MQAFAEGNALDQIFSPPGLLKCCYELFWVEMTEYRFQTVDESKNEI